MPSYMLLFNLQATAFVRPLGP